MGCLEGKDLARIDQLTVGPLRLERLTSEDVLELLTLRFFLRAVPAWPAGRLRAGRGAFRRRRRAACAP